MTPSEQQQTGTETTAELLARRTQLQEWLARLDEVGSDIPAQVARRVREDYEQRLAAVMAELAAHSEALASDRERLEERLLAAAERHDAAIEALEEARLRHRIGELSDEHWEERRPGLEAEVAAAAEERAKTEREMAALDDLLRQVAVGTHDDEATVEDGGPAAATPADGPAWDADAPVSEAPQPTSFADAAAEWDPDLPLLEEVVVPAPQEDSAEGGEGSREGSAHPPQASFGGVAAPDDELVEITAFAAEAEALANELDPEHRDDDYAFLQELDRAIAATAPRAPAEEDVPSAETRPQPGLKCPECGYSNDPAAWYCGVCGVDLG
ncbi:MAG TPA: zinc ribbon domain-containing protein [Longimicrobiaceae bacterium]